jgi:hypothetical protein
MRTIGDRDCSGLPPRANESAPGNSPSPLARCLSGLHERVLFGGGPCVVNGHSLRSVYSVYLILLPERRVMGEGAILCGVARSTTAAPTRERRSGSRTRSRNAGSSGSRTACVRMFSDRLCCSRQTRSPRSAAISPDWVSQPSGRRSRQPPADTVHDADDLSPGLLNRLVRAYLRVPGRPDRPAVPHPANPCAPPADGRAVQEGAAREAMRRLPWRIMGPGPTERRLPGAGNLNDARVVTDYAWDTDVGRMSHSWCILRHPCHVRHPASSLPNSMQRLGIALPASWFYAGGVNYASGSERVSAPAPLPL